MGTYVVGITGAYGYLYAVSLIKSLLAMKHQVLLTITRAGKVVLEYEQQLSLAKKDKTTAQLYLRNYFGAGENLCYYDVEDIAAPMASGSAKPDAMVVLPCSMGTLGSIRAGISDNLLQRAADVMLKERRPLILVPREAPYNTIHLENMTDLSRMGVVIMPASPGFYHLPNSLEELILQFTGRILDQLGIDNQTTQRWQGL